MLRARLFGGLSVEVDGRPVPTLPGARPASVLAFLLLHPGPHGRAGLAGRFWPDVMDASALASLRNAVWAIRRALEAVGGGAYLAADRRTVGIAPDLPRQVDAEEFARLSAEDAPEAWERAAALASGPLVPEIGDEWATVARDELRDRLAGALERLGDAAEAAGDPAAAADWARRALAHDPVRERVHRALIRRLAAQGRRDGALAAYRRCRAVLAAELGVAPGPETRALAARLEAAEGPLRPAAATGERPEPMVGRAAELAALRRAWAGARAGRGGLVAVAGGAGIGKSRLLEEVATEARAGGARVVRGSGLELEGAPPFAPWSEALRELVDATPAPPPEAAWAAELARLCPSVATAWDRRPPGPAGAPDLERARLFEAVAGAVAWCAADAPLLLVLEDLHLADAASLALLAYVGRRLPELDALLVASRRDTVLRAELEVALEGLRRRGAVVSELSLGPLAPAAVREVVAAVAPALGAADAGRAAALAEGNPLLARAAARSLAAGEDPADGLRAAVRGPLAGLPVAARLTVDLAAAAARPLRPAELAGPVGAEALPDAVAAGVAADLLAAGPDDRIRFRHALIRAACYAELPAGRRAWLHAALAGALGARAGRAPAEVARHLRLAGDDAGARRELAAAAAEARALGALEEAAAYLREAADLATGEPAAQAELWLELAGVEAWRGRRAEWDAAFSRAEALLEAAGDARGLARAHELRGRWLRTTLCFPREALTAYDRALAVIDANGLDAPELRALALAGAAWAEAMAGDPERVDALADGAAAVPETAGDRALAAEIALARAAALVRRGRMEEAEEPYAQAAALAEAAGRPDLAHVAWANVASAAACRGEFARALALAERAGSGEAGDRRAGPILAAFVQAARAHALSRLGRHGEAEAAAEAAAGLAARSGDPAREAGAAFDRGAVALAAGRPAAAARHLAAALEAPGGGVPRPLARLLRAEALLAAEGPDAAEHELGRVPFEPVGAADLPDTLVARLSRLQGRVALARGDAELALRRLAEAERGWRRRLAPAASGDLFAATLVDLGRPPVAGLVEPGVELGRTLADRAEALAALGRAEEAAAAAAEAAGLAERLGFDGYLARLAGATAEGG
jgi:DNA-binding SARP family transcriptional activator